MPPSQGCLRVAVTLVLQALYVIGNQAEYVSQQLIIQHSKLVEYLYMLEYTTQAHGDIIMVQSVMHSKIDVPSCIPFALSRYHSLAVAVTVSHSWAVCRKNQRMKV